MSRGLKPATTAMFLALAEGEEEPLRSAGSQKDLVSGAMVC